MKICIFHNYENLVISEFRSNPGTKVFFRESNFQRHFSKRTKCCATRLYAQNKHELFAVNKSLKFTECLWFYFGLTERFHCNFREDYCYTAYKRSFC